MRNPKIRFKNVQGTDFPDWSRSSLGLLCQMYQPTTLSKQSLDDSGPYAVYGANGIIGKHSQFNHADSEVVVSCRGANCGSVQMTKPCSWINGNAMVVHPRNRELLKKEFLNYLLSCQNFQRVTTGGAQPQITRVNLSDLMISIPSFLEQQKIASFFSTLDQKIELNERKLEALEKLKKWVMQRIFNQNIRFFSKDGTTYPNWKIVKLSDVADTFNGDRGKNYPSSQDYVPTGIPFINAGDLINGSVSESCARITIAKYNSLSGAKLQKGDILYCLRGTLGKNGVCPFDAGTLASSLMAIRAKDCINPAYLYYFLNSHLEREQRLLNDEGAAQPNLSQKNVRNFQIPLPCIEEQQKIADLLSILGRRIEIERKRAEAMRKLKQGFMQQMFI